MEYGQVEEMTNRGIGRGQQAPGGVGPSHHMEGAPEPNPPVLQGQRGATFMYHTPRGCYRPRSHSPAGGGRRSAWLLELPLSGRPHHAGYQPQLWLHVSATSLPTLVS